MILKYLTCIVFVCKQEVMLWPKLCKFKLKYQKCAQEVKYSNKTHKISEVE